MDNRPGVIPKKHKPPRGEKPKKGCAVGFIPALIGLVLLVAAAAGFVIWQNRDDFTRDDIGRFFDNVWETLGGGGDGSAEVINIDSQQGSIVKPFGDGLAVLTANRFVCYSASGTDKMSVERVFITPAMSVSAKNAVAYDRGGNTLVFAGRSGFILNEQTENTIITAKLNKNGWLTLATRAKNGKSEVTVYNNQGEEMMTYRTPDYFVMDAQVSPDNRSVALAVSEFRDGWLAGGLIILKTDSETVSPLIEIPVAEELLFPKNDRICVISENRVNFYDGVGTPLGEVTLGGRLLLDWSELDSGLAVRTAQTASGTAGRLAMLNWNGKQVAEITLTRDIISQSGAGGRVTLVSAGSVDLYDSELNLELETENKNHTRQVLQKANGEMFFIYNDTAMLFRPNVGGNNK